MGCRVSVQKQKLKAKGKILHLEMGVTSRCISQNAVRFCGKVCVCVFVEDLHPDVATKPP